MHNNELMQSLSAYKKILGYSYHFVIGRKNQQIDITLNFSKRDFFHLAGLQYLKNIRELKNDREKIFNKIENESDFLNLIINNDFYSQISDRINFLAQLEGFLDNNETVFKFNNRTNSCSLIDADYILKNSDIEKNMYIFISRDDKKSDTYFCRSAFTRDKSEKDYVMGHTAYTLLYKEKTNLITNEKQILYVRPSYQKQLSSQPQQQDNNNIKQIKFDLPVTAHNVHIRNGTGEIAADPPIPNPLKNVLEKIKIGLSKIFKPKDKPSPPTMTVQTEEATNTPEEIPAVPEETVPEAEAKPETTPTEKALAALAEARESFAQGRISKDEYVQSVRNCLHTLNRAGTFTQAAEALRKELADSPEKMRGYIRYELANIEKIIEKRTAPKQTLRELEAIAHEKYMKMQKDKENNAEPPERETKSYSER